MQYQETYVTIKKTESGLLITGCQKYFMDYWVYLCFNEVSNYEQMLKLFIED